jgi:hypothetical protein
LPSWKTNPLILLRDAVLVASIAVVTFLGLGRWFGDYYRVPSGSMEPTLHGDATTGDIVFVDKLASHLVCHRHDLVVVAHPKDPTQQLVKRIGASGDDADACWIDLRDGDVWLGPDRQHMRREKKDPIEARALRVVWAVAPSRVAEVQARLDLRDARIEAATIALPPLDVGAEGARSMMREGACAQRRRSGNGRVVPAGCLGTARAVDSGYVLATGGLDGTRDDKGVFDCGLELAVQTLPAGMLCTIDANGEALTFHWVPADGRITLWRNGEDVESAVLPAVTGGAHRIEFGRLDDRVFFVIDGRADAMVCIDRRAEWPDGDRTSMRTAEPRTYLHVGVIGSAPMTLANVIVFRDLFAVRDRNFSQPGSLGDWPRFVPVGHWFLLGDNAFDSRDSRFFDAVPSSSYLGRPWFVLGPWPRQRWLQ